MVNRQIIWILLTALAAWLAVEFAAQGLGDWVFYAAGIIIAVLLFWTQRQLKTQRDIISLLSEQCDPAAFLKAYEAEMAAVKTPQQLDLLRINQAAGLCYDGAFDKALRVLRSIDFDSLQGMYKAHYYNNLVSVLILAGRDNEALRTADKGQEYLNASVRNRELDTALLGTRGGVALLRGDTAECRSLFGQLLSRSPAPLMGATAHLFLGRCALAEGLSGEARTHYEAAAAQGGKTIIARQARKTLEGLPAEAAEGE